MDKHAFCFMDCRVFSASRKTKPLPHLVMSCLNNTKNQIFCLTCYNWCNKDIPGNVAQTLWEAVEDEAGEEPGEEERQSFSTHVRCAHQVRQRRFFVAVLSFPVRPESLDKLLDRRHFTAVTSGCIFQDSEGFLLSAHGQQPPWGLGCEPVTDIRLARRTKA